MYCITWNVPILKVRKKLKIKVMIIMNTVFSKKSIITSQTKVTFTYVYICSKIQIKADRH
jgi:hypothetical protein